MEYYSRPSEVPLASVRSTANRTGWDRCTMIVPPSVSIVRASIRVCRWSRE